MATRHLVFLVEEPSMEAFIHALLPKILPQGHNFEVHAFQGKSDLKSKLENRLRGYAKWLPVEWRLFILVDRDEEDCRILKQWLEEVAGRAGLITPSRANSRPWQLVNRIVVEELEAWYFGDWDAVMGAYPRVSATISKKNGLRETDAIKGGTWETFERIMRKYGYFENGLTKIDAAQRIAPHILPERNRSPSFRAFHSALIEAMG